MPTSRWGRHGSRAAEAAYLSVLTFAALARVLGVTMETLLYGVSRTLGRHRRVTERRELTMKGRDVRCAACGITWPCEVGQVLSIIDMLLRS